MIAVGLYKKDTKPSPDGERHFYRRMGETEVATIVPSLKAIAELDGKEYTFYYDKSFSKEAGHHAYVRSGDAKPALTPFSESDGNIIDAEIVEPVESTDGHSNN
jgi:hypothetical protein